MDSKSQIKSNTNNPTLFWSFLFVTLFLVLVVVVVLIIFSVQVYKYKNAIITSIKNKNECQTDPHKCAYYNVNPEIPDVFPENEFSQPLALFVGQLIFNVEYVNQTKDLFIPEPLELVGSIFTKEKTAPLFSIVVLDKINKVLYIITRGTRTKTEWKFDFTYQQIQPFTGFSNKNWTFDEETLVHSGFYSLFLQVQPQLQRIVEQNLPFVDKIILAGHSLGGAITSLYSAFLSTNITQKPLLTYTFGKPRVGNIVYSEDMNKHMTFWRMENEDDPVPSLPWSVTPNVSNPNQSWIYQQEGKNKTYMVNWKSSLLNHSMQSYMTWLETY